MLQWREVVYLSAERASAQNLLLTADIGGTNANFGLFITKESDNKSLLLLASFHCKSGQILNFEEALRQVLARIESLVGVVIVRLCIAAAGILSENRRFVKATNLQLSIDLDRIVAKTAIADVELANDFEVIGYAIDVIDPKSIVLVRPGVARAYANKAVLGAGTGLGKSILFWNVATERYESIPSEGGHADCPFYTVQDLEIVDFIRTEENMLEPLSFENLLSGAGIRRLHRFFGHCINGYSGGELPADEIFARRHDDQICWNTYQKYTQLMGRCAKNFILESLCLGGLYIAGGIAAHNVALFEQEAFVAELKRAGKLLEVIDQVPIYVLADYNVSLYGAARYFMMMRAT